MREANHGWLFRVARYAACVLAYLSCLSVQAMTKPEAKALCISRLQEQQPAVNNYCHGIGQGDAECRDNKDAQGGGGYYQAQCGPHKQLFYYIYSGCEPNVKDHSRTALPIQGALSDVPPQCKQGCEVKPREGTCYDTFMVEALAGSVSCSWYSTGNACEPNKDVGDDDKCVTTTGGKKLCFDDDAPKVCASVEGGETVCVNGDGNDPPCVAGSTAAVCQPPTPPPNPPIDHNPPWNPNPPPPDFDFTVNNNNFNYWGGGDGGGGGDDPPPPPPPSPGLCGTAGNPPCPTPSTCGQTGQPPCNNEGNPPTGNGCGGRGQPVCDGGGNAACGRPGTPACNENGTPSCGVIGTPLCADDGGPACGIVGRPQCTTTPPSPGGGSGSGGGGGPGYGGPACGGEGQQACVGGGLGGCGSVGQPPCSWCGGVGQAPCGSCGAVGQPPCCTPGDPGCEEGGGTASGGGSCGTPPACAGDSVNCAVLYQTYMTRCEVQRYNNYADGSDDFGPSYTPADGVEPEGDGVDVSAMLDASGFWGSGTCDVPASIDVFGTSYALDPEGRLCDFLGIGALLVLLFSYYYAARIVAGGIS